MTSTGEAKSRRDWWLRQLRVTSTVRAGVGGAVELRRVLDPAGRVGRPEEIASTIAYLCSDLAGYISGNWIGVDGGKHKSLF